MKNQQQTIRAWARHWSDATLARQIARLRSIAADWRHQTLTDMVAAADATAVLTGLQRRRREDRP
jgi:hypothetical protein